MTSETEIKRFNQTLIATDKASKEPPLTSVMNLIRVIVTAYSTYGYLPGYLVSTADLLKLSKGSDEDYAISTIGASFSAIFSAKNSAPFFKN